MTQKNTPTALDHVDSRRRGFLTRLLAGGAAAAALPAMSSFALADDENPAGKGKGGKGKGGKGEFGGKGKGGQGKGGRGGDPAQMAAMLIQRFDKDGDGALNAKELAAALTAMRQRFAGKGKGGGEGKGNFGGGKGKGGGQGGQGGQGQRPKRPE